MNLNEIVLVTKNDKGTEINMLMTSDDYKKFVSIDDMSELADQMLCLGRTPQMPCSLLFCSMTLRILPP